MSEHKVAVVGTPCEIMAASKIQHYTKSPIDFKIGLFCMENFSYSYFIELLKETNDYEYAKSIGGLVWEI